MKSAQLSLLLFGWRDYEASRAFNMGENTQEAVRCDGDRMEPARSGSCLQILAVPPPPTPNCCLLCHHEEGPQPLPSLVPRGLCGEDAQGVSEFGKPGGG